MDIRNVTHIRICVPGATVDLLDVDRLEVDAALAYAKVMATGGRMVQAIKFIRSTFGLRLKEAKFICDDLRRAAVREELWGGDDD